MVETNAHLSLSHTTHTHNTQLNLVAVLRRIPRFGRSDDFTNLFVDPSAANDYIQGVLLYGGLAFGSFLFYSLFLLYPHCCRRSSCCWGGRSNTNNNPNNNQTTCWSRVFCGCCRRTSPNHGQEQQLQQQHKEQQDEQRGLKTHSSRRRSSSSAMTRRSLLWMLWSGKPFRHYPHRNEYDPNQDDHNRDMYHGVVPNGHNRAVLTLARNTPTTNGSSQHNRTPAADPSTAARVGRSFQQFRTRLKASGYFRLLVLVAAGLYVLATVLFVTRGLEPMREASERIHNHAMVSLSSHNVCLERTVERWNDSMR